jgi:hypothetical protein
MLIKFLKICFQCNDFKICLRKYKGWIITKIIIRGNLWITGHVEINMLRAINPVSRKNITDESETHNIAKT